MDKFVEAARADYEALYKDSDMIAYLAARYRELNDLDPENHGIDSHWVFSLEE